MPEPTETNRLPSPRVVVETSLLAKGMERIASSLRHIALGTDQYVKGTWHIQKGTWQIAKGTRRKHFFARLMRQKIRQVVILQGKKEKLHRGVVIFCCSWQNDQRLMENDQCLSGSY